MCMVASLKGTLRCATDVECQRLVNVDEELVDVEVAGLNGLDHSVEGPSVGGFVGDADDATNEGPIEAVKLPPRSDGANNGDAFVILHTGADALHLNAALDR